MDYFACQVRFYKHVTGIKVFLLYHLLAVFYGNDLFRWYKHLEDEIAKVCVTDCGIKHLFDFCFLAGNGTKHVPRTLATGFRCNVMRSHGRL